MSPAALAVLTLLGAAEPRVEAGALDLATLPTEALFREAHARATRMGTYRMRYTKEERLAKGWVGPQVMDLVIREQPFAVRARVVQGPNEGRAFLYDVTQRKEQLRVREAGILGVAALWIDIDSALTRDDTSHPVTELGFGFLYKVFERDSRAAQSAGGYVRTDEGLVGGNHCLTLTAQKAAGLYAVKSRMCFAPKTLALTKLEVWDAKGLLERFSFEVTGTHVKEAFDADAI